MELELRLFGFLPLYFLIIRNLGSFTVKCNSDISCFVVCIFISPSLLCEQFHTLSLSYPLLDKAPYLLCSEPGNVQNTITNTRQWGYSAALLRDVWHHGKEAMSTERQPWGSSSPAGSGQHVKLLFLFWGFQPVWWSPFRLIYRCSYRWDLLKCYWRHRVLSSLHSGSIHWRVRVACTYSNFYAYRCLVPAFRWHKTNGRGVPSWVIVYERL